MDKVPGRIDIYMDGKNGASAMHKNIISSGVEGLFYCVYHHDFSGSVVVTRYSIANIYKVVEYEGDY